MQLAAIPAQDRYRSHRLPVSGGTLTCGVWEPADRPSAPITVLALHGLTGNHRCWPFVADQLPDVEVVAPDLRGRGASAGITGPFGLARHAEDMVAVLDSLEISSAVVVGHSMGANVALVLANRHRDRIRSLLLVDGGLPMGACTTDPEGEVQRVTATLSGRLAVVFPTETSALQFWRQRPAFEGAWTPMVEDYARYDLGGREPRLRSRVTRASVMADSRDIVAGPDLARALEHPGHSALWLVAPRGVMNEVPGLYPPTAVVHWHETYPWIQVWPVNDVNHYTIVMSRKGGRAIAAAVERGPG